MYTYRTGKDPVMTKTTEPDTVAAVPLDGTLAVHIYEAECALHAARQSGIDPWVKAAAGRLHLLLVLAGFAPPISEPDAAPSPTPRGRRRRCLVGVQAPAAAVRTKPQAWRDR
jgi:hypothetical protein